MTHPIWPLEGVVEPHGLDPWMEDAAVRYVVFTLGGLE